MGQVPIIKPPWEGCFHGESIDVAEYQNEVLQMKVCRSTRADLRHKLEIIIQAHGGYRRDGLKRAAAKLKVSRYSLYRWLQWRNVPGRRYLWERIDNQYEDAIGQLAAEQLARRAKQKKS